MNVFAVTLGLTLALLSIALIGFCVRVFLVKDGSFKGGCGSNNPMLTNEIGECQVCGAKPEEACKGDEEDQRGNEPLPQIG